METAEGAEQEGRQPDNYYWWLPVAIVALFLLAFETAPGPTPVTLVTTQPPPTVATPVLEPVIFETAGEPDPEARFFLNIIVLDENGRPTRATITVTWLHNELPKPLVFEEESEVEVPIPAGWTPVLMSVTKLGYWPMQQVFEARLGRDLAHKWVVRLFPVGEAA
jgi:hypothetical protein